MLNHKYTASAAPGPQKGGSPLRRIERLGWTLVPVTPDVAHRLHDQRSDSLCHSVARRRLGNIGHMCGIRRKTNDTPLFMGTKATCVCTQVATVVWAMPFGPGLYSSAPSSPPHQAPRTSGLGPSGDDPYRTEPLRGLGGGPSQASPPDPPG